MARSHFYMLAVAAFALAGRPTLAADMPVPRTNADPTNAAQVFVFSGFDATTQSSYTSYVGANFAPFGNLETSGVRFSLFGAAGTYRYAAEIGTATRVRGVFETGDALVGYGLNTDNFSAKFLVGLNVQNHDLSPFDPNNAVRGTVAGAKVQGDFYATPTERTMAFGLASYSTAFNTYYAELKAGYDFFNVKELYLGPQAIAQGNDRYDQWRVGAHLTGIKIGKAELGLAGGYLQDSQNGPGAYGMISLNFDF